MSTLKETSPSSFCDVPSQMQRSLKVFARAALQIKLTGAPSETAPTAEICLVNKIVKINHPEAGLERAEFPFIWLRDACQSSVDASTQQRLFNTTDIEKSIKPLGVDLVNDKLMIRWDQPLRSSTSQNTETSVYSLDFLARHASNAALNAHLSLNEPCVLWDKNQLTRDNLTLPYDRLSEPEVKKAALRQVIRYGIVFFSGVSTEDKSDAGCELAKLAAQVGTIRRTWYGEHTWDVQSVANAKNIAYTNLDLGQCLNFARNTL